MAEPYIVKSNDLDLKSFFAKLLRTISFSPSTVTLDERTHSNVWHLSICVDAQDFEMLAGAGQRTFIVLQTIFSSLTRKEGMLATLEVINRPTGARLA